MFTYVLGRGFRTHKFLKGKKPTSFGSRKSTLHTLEKHWYSRDQGQDPQGQTSKKIAFPELRTENTKLKTCAWRGFVEFGTQSSSVFRNFSNDNKSQRNLSTETSPYADALAYC